MCSVWHCAFDMPDSKHLLGLCCLLSPSMYEMFGYPVLKKVFARFSPDHEDKRYQHSDSAMEHLLPILGRLNLNGVNFGPTVMAPAIRKYMPEARIDGCIAPFTFMNNDREGPTPVTFSPRAAAARQTSS